MSESQDPSPEAKKPEVEISEEFHDLKEYLESWDSFTQVQFRYLRKRISFLEETVSQFIAAQLKQ